MTDRQSTNHNISVGHNCQVWPAPNEKVTDLTSPRHTEITVHKMVALQFWHNPCCYLFQECDCAYRYIVIELQGNCSWTRHVYLSDPHRTSGMGWYSSDSTASDYEALEADSSWLS